MTPKILVVDDEPQIRRVMKAALAIEDYFVADAKSAMEALEKLRQDRYDLVLLDMNMPGMSGLEACTEIRKTSDVGIIMLTVRDSEANKVAALDAGADDYVTKPFSMPELLARIRAHLRRVPYSTANGPASITFGDVEMNVATRHVFVKGKDVRMTPKEFDLLHYFATHPNITIPHGKLLQTVWGPDYGNEIEYLHVFVNQIRKKIEANPAKPCHLITELRVGYRFRLGDGRSPT
ncbi:MAG: response regulator transcription factor [Acidobacteriaceae bacterium]|nr:response regulator transcription factor [Acidobacteriaceae bacterium]MBV9501928.1 response regulator transcription factor [Acidobacteriaceae bacterium]